jgi:hypothetical protein
MLLYVDEANNLGPGEFVMHGVNLFFRRGALTGPVTQTVAGIVTSRKKKPMIRIATADEVKALQSAPEQEADAGDDKSGDNSGEKAGEETNTAGTNTETPPDTKNDDNTTGGMTAPGDPKPDASPTTERKPKLGTKLTTG